MSHLTRLKSELEGKPIDATDTHFPEISASTYEKILETARPLSGPVLSYFLLAQTYHLLGKEKVAKACAGKALENASSHPKDLEVMPIIIRDFIAILADLEKDRGKLELCVQRAITNRMLGGSAPLSFLVFCVFQQADTAYETDKSNKLLPVLVSICEEILQNHSPDEAFWRSEVLIRRAKLLRTNAEFSSKTKEQYVRALIASRESRNSRVMIESSHALGFDLYAQAGSLKQLADYQFAQVEAIELEAEHFDRLTVLGSNLLKLWGGISWRRLLETDLVTKKYLMDCAHEMMVQNTPITSAAPAMILLLAKLFTHSGSSVEWARAQCLSAPARLPDQVSILLDLPN